MLRLLVNWLYKHCPTCSCGYKMKPIKAGFDYSWKCIWIKRCGWEAHETFNGKLHWKKS